MNNFFSTVGEIIKYGGSTFAALITVSLYTATDGFFIGNWVGRDGLEAVALIYPVSLIIGAFCILFETGGSAVISEKIGANKTQLAEKIMRSNYAFAIFLGTIVSIVANIFIEPLLQSLASGSEELHIVNLAISFLRISLCGIPFLLVFYMTGAFMRCIGQPTHVLYLTGTGALINIILDALFIVVFGWGMQGAAAATLIAQIIGAAMTLWYFKYSRQKFKTPLSFASLGYIFQEIKIGAGFGMANLMVAAIEYFLNATLLHYDAAHLLAALAVSNIFLSFVYLPLTGLDTGTQPLVSKAFAANKREHCANIMRCGFLLTLLVTLAMYAVLMIFTGELANIFSNEPVTAEMITFMRMVFLFLPFIGIYTWLSGVMAALEDEWCNIIVNLSPLIVQVPLIWLLPKFIPIEYVALSYSLQDVAEASIAFLLVRGFLKSKGLSLKNIFNLR